LIELGEERGGVAHVDLTDGDVIEATASGEPGTLRALGFGVNVARMPACSFFSSAEPSFLEHRIRAASEPASLCAAWFFVATAPGIGLACSARDTSDPEAMGAPTSKEDRP
jgi:hypothetical protein